MNSMPDIFYLVSKWWKQILSVVLLSLAIAIVVLYLLPKRYASVATALPASTYASDKAGVFNNNIQILYPTLGTPDDLDMIVGTAQLDTAYIAVVEQFDLVAYYKVREQSDAAIRKAASLLKKNTRVIKSEYNELKVKTWDRDRTMAPKFANAIMHKLQSIHQDVQNSNNVSMVKSLEAGREKLKADIDSISNYLKKALVDEDTAGSYYVRKKILIDQLQQYEKLIIEYQLLIDKKPPVLVIVEQARIADWPDKPAKWPILAGTFVLSLLFALLLVLLLEKRKV